MLQTEQTSQQSTDACHRLQGQIARMKSKNKTRIGTLTASSKSGSPRTARLVSIEVMLFRICFAIFLGGAIANPAEFKFANQTFTLPAGFEIELVAGPPMVDRPIV